MPDPYHQIALNDYASQFLAVDGSNASLIIPGDVHSIEQERIPLKYDTQTRRLSLPGGGNYSVAGRWTLVTADGTAYTFDVAGTENLTARLNRVTAANGTTTLVVRNGSLETITSNDVGITIHRNAAGRVDWMADRPNGTEADAKVTYVYDSEMLATVIDAARQTTHYDYKQGLLQKVTDARNVPILRAEYDPQGRLTALLGPDNKSAVVATGGFNGAASTQGTINALRDESEFVYDNRGNVVRNIKTITNPDGSLAGYSVAVSEYYYFGNILSNQINNIFQSDATGIARPGSASMLGLLQRISQFQSFEIRDPKEFVERYTRQPKILQHETEFHFISDAAEENPNQGMVKAEKTFLRKVGTDVFYRVVAFEDYLHGKPTRTDSLVQRAPNGILNQSVNVGPSTTTWSTFDGNDNLTSSRVTSTDGVDRTTYFVYNMPVGPSLPFPDLSRNLLIATYTLAADGSRVYQSQTTYYTADSGAGARKGSVRSTKEPSSADAGGNVRETFLTYTPDGNVARSYYRWKNAAGGADRWIVSTTMYDAAGRPTKTAQAVYEATADSDLSLSANVGDNDAYGYRRIINSELESPRDLSTTVYGPRGTAISVTDQFGATTHYQHDIKGNLIRTINADQTQTISVYDVLGRLILSVDRHVPGQTDPIQGTRTVYNSLGQVTETQRIPDLEIEVSAVSNYVGVFEIASIENAGVIADGEYVWKIDPTYSGAGARNRTVYNEAGQVSETISAAGLRSGTLYDDAGRPQFTGDVVQSASTPNARHIVFNAGAGTYLINYASYEYDKIGNDPNGVERVFDKVIDARDHSTTTFKDTNGRTVFVVYHDGTVARTRYSHNDNDIEGFIDEIPAGGSAVISFAQGEAATANLGTIRVSDAAGRLVDVYLPAVDDATTTSPHDVRPRWHYTYDAHGNQLTQVDPYGHTTSFAYDEHGRRVFRKLPPDSDGNANNDFETWTYDDEGRLDTHRDFKGQTTKSTYETTPAFAGRLLEEQRFSGDAVSTPKEKTKYSYDALGRQSIVEEFFDSDANEAARTTTYSYNPLGGQVSQIASPEGTINYAYDDLTGRKTRTWTANNDTAYSYDEHGRLANVYALEVNGTIYGGFTSFNSSTQEPVLSGTPLKTSYAYDAIGNLASTAQDNGTAASTDDITTSYVYDNLNRLTDETVSRSGTNLFTQHYDLRGDGQRNWVIETRIGDAAPTKITWTYDANNRLTVETRDVGNDGQDGNDYIDTYAFDLVGNRIKKDHNAANNTADETITSNYNDRDQLLVADSNVAGKDQRFWYDTNGSTIREETGTASGSQFTATSAKGYAWDLRNRMTGYDATGNGVFTDEGDIIYGYDESDHRVSHAEIGAATTNYVLDKQNPTGYAKAIEERSSPTGASVRSYILGLDVIGQSDATNGALHLMKDAHGTTRGLVNSTGNVLERYDFDAFGNKVEYTDASGNHISGDPLTTWLMGDGYRDSVTHLDRNGERDVASWLGQFMTTDPGWQNVHDRANPASLNLRLYANANPVHYNDPSGNDFTVAEMLPELGIESDLMATQLVTAYPAWVKATAVITSLGMIAGGGLAWTQNGSPTTWTAYVLRMQTQLQTNPVAAGQAYQQAVQTAVATGKGSKQKIQSLPVFFVFRSITPQIYQNDVSAMAGAGTMGGASAPFVLNYGGPGTNAINRPRALSWAASAGIVAGSGESLDEYPFASTVEGGATPCLRVAPVAVSEQDWQRDDLRAFYGAQQFQPFMFLVVPIP